MAVKPITPDEVAARKRDALPPQVIEVFNQLIAEHWTGSSATFTQSDAIAAIVARCGGDNGPLHSASRSEVLRRGWLDVEDVYREAGWHVVFDKPGYNERYEAFYKFSRPVAR